MGRPEEDQVPSQPGQSGSRAATPGRTLVLGLGNPILGDDAIGWRIAEALQKLLQDPSTEVDFLDRGGLSLMERLVGYDRAVLIDAISTGSHPVGTVCHFSLEELPDPAAGHLASSHDTTLQTALELGRQLGLPLPTRIEVIGVEARRDFEFNDRLSPEVEAALPEAVQAALRAIQAVG